MAKGSPSRKVSRVASTGGGRTARGRIPWVWYGSLVIIAVLGISGVVFSREQRLNAIEAGGGARPRPPANGQQGDHWHASLAFYVCDKMLPNITDQKDPAGIHTHADGVIHIHPFTRKAAGPNATLGKFADAVGLELDVDSFQLAGDKKHKTGDKCGGKKAEVKYEVDGKLYEGNPDKLLLKDNQLITVALVPDGVDIPAAPAERLQTLNDVPGASTTLPPGLEVPPSIPGAEGETTDTSAPAEGSSDTSAPPSADSTVPPTSAP